MKTTYILIAIIVIVLFSLFYRLYRYKYENFTDTDVCVLKDTLKKNYIAEESYKLYFNKKTPLTFAGSVFYTDNSHREFIEEFLKQLILNNSYFINLNVYLEKTNYDNGFPIYNYLFSDLEYDAIEAFQSNTENTNTTATIKTEEQKFTFDNIIKESCSSKSETSDNNTNDNDKKEEDFGEEEEEAVEDFGEEEEEVKTNTCNYFAVQVKFKLSQEMLEKLNKFLIINEKSLEKYKTIVNNVVELKNYNQISKNFFNALHAAKNFYFSRNYIENTKSIIDLYNGHEKPDNALVLMYPNEEFYAKIKKLKEELENNDLDNETLLEEMFAIKNLNLLDIKKSIKDKINNSVCSGEYYIPERIKDKRDLIKYLGELDKNASKIHEATGLNNNELIESSNKYALFHEKYKNQLEELLFKNFDLTDFNTDEKIKEYENTLILLNNQISNLKRKDIIKKSALEDFKLKKRVSLKSLEDGTILNFTRIVENGKFVDKYMIMVNDGCLKYNGINLSIEYDWKYQMRNPQIHFNIEIIENEKEYLAKMNYMIVDEERNKNLEILELPVILISPSNLYGKVLVLRDSRIFIENCTGRKEEQFKIHQLTNNECSYVDTKTN